MKKKKIIIAVIAFVAIIMMFTGCTKREITTIEANQTAFLIPLNGDTGEQASFESEELLSDAKVAAKQVTITYTWKTLQFLKGSFVPDNMLVIVDRTPATREWAETSDVGTSTANQAISAESKESIGFSVGMNCSAQIYTEQDAVKFLYSYNNKSLDEIMDSEIRARVESDFVEKCADYTMGDILEKKQDIMDYVRDDVTEYFYERGITITVLGMKDGIEYDDAAVQAAINASFTAQKNQEAQTIQNKTNIETANAEAESRIIVAQSKADAALIEASADAESNQKIANSITDGLIDYIYAKTWDGKLPTVSTDGNSIISIPDIG